MSEKQFKLKQEQIKRLLETEDLCLVSDKITVEGMPVGYMYRDEPEDNEDSGWCFLSGTENQNYADNPRYSTKMDLNTLANYDPAVIPYLDKDVGTEWERVAGEDKFSQL